MQEAKNDEKVEEKRNDILRTLSFMELKYRRDQGKRYRVHCNYS